MKAIVLRKPWLLLQLAALTWCYRADVEDLRRHQANSEVGPQYLLDRIKSAARLRVRIRRACRELGLPVPDFTTTADTPVSRTTPARREALVRRAYHVGTVAVLAATGALLFAQPAHATNCGDGGLTHWDDAAGVCRPVRSTTPSAPTPAPVAQAAAQAGAGAQSDASAWQNQTSTNAQGVNTRNDSRYYLIPGTAPVNAAPLPAGLCQEGDSDSIDWAFPVLFRYAHATSKTRINMECMDKALAHRAAAAPAPMRLSDERLAHPIPESQTIVLMPAPTLAAAPKPRKRPATVAGQTVRAAAPKCAAGEVLVCRAR